MNTWTAIYDYDPDDDVWLAHMAEDERVHTWGKTLAQAKRHVRDAVTLWAETPVDVVDKVNPPSPAAEAVERYRQLRIDQQNLAIELARAAVIAEGALRQAGLSVREAGAVLGISHQRVSQLRIAKKAPRVAIAAKAASRAKAVAKDPPLKAAPRKVAGVKKKAPSRSS